MALASGKIPATVITGFLGAGKTSLIRHLALTSQGRRLAFLINEFGDLGIDRAILTGCGIEGCTDDEVVELANGCICCTVADDFLPAMNAILGRDPQPEHIIIETSGLALPKPLVKAFAWPDIRNRSTVDAVISVVDAKALDSGLFAPDPTTIQAQREADETLDHESPLEEVFEEQVGCADMIVINKSDLVPAARRPAIEAMIARHARPSVRWLWSTAGNVEARVLLGLGVAAESDLDSRHSHHDDGESHDHDDFTSFIVRLPEVDDPERVEAVVRDIAAAHAILRVKGLLAVRGKPMRHVLQAVGTRIDRYYDRAWADVGERSSSLVVIGLQGLDRRAVERAFEDGLGQN